MDIKSYIIFSKIGGYIQKDVASNMTCVFDYLKDAKEYIRRLPKEQQELHDIGTVYIQYHKKPFDD